MMADPNLTDILRVRATVLRTTRHFFEDRKFVEVSTPILSAAAGGATARPFTTRATEFQDSVLSLRVAPELWLKRLIVGGMDKVFEIGPSFRNEGLDLTHNPEFTTCEFYATSHTVEDLMVMTQELLTQIAQEVQRMKLSVTRDSPLLIWDHQQRIARVDFLPDLERLVRLDLPDLDSPHALDDLNEIFRMKKINLPSRPTLPRMLDKLSSVYLEPLSLKQPLWITRIPECLSPLAKSGPSPTKANSRVSYRAELFINGKELINCYEEENSPFEQRRKFVGQQQYARQFGHSSSGGDGTSKPDIDDEAMEVDEHYLQALEWGLPPTGGWGCGIDRLVMMLTGRERIGDVLSFGNLRAVARGAPKLLQRKIEYAK
jgi:lysyl-tRNA synthetase, class II